MALVVIIQDSYPVSWIFPKKYWGTPLSKKKQMEQDRQTCSTPRENSRKWGARIENQKNLIARLPFSMMILWRRLHRDFLRFVNWTRPSGRWSNFYRPAQGQHPLLFALSTAESLSCPKSIGSIGGFTIFQGQPYSRYSKAGGCRAAQLLAVD